MFEDKRMLITGKEIRFIQSPSKDRNIIYIHGGFGDIGVARMLDKYFGNEFGVLAPYLPGHGSFSFDDTYGYKDMVETISKFIEKMQLANCIIVGHSFGGRIAYDIACKSNVKIKKAVLLAPMLAPINSSIVLAATHIVHDYINDLGFSSKGPLQRDTVVSRIRNMSSVWRMITSVGAVDNFKEKIPLSVIWGKDDTVLPFMKNEPIVKKMSKTKLETYPGGHYWPFKISNLQVVEKHIKT